MKKHESCKEKVRRAVNALLKEEEPSATDPFGSYTGKPADPNEIPQQDADDL